MTGAPDKIAAFTARLDAKLETLPPAERERFLSKHLIWWTSEYSRWAARVDRGEETQMDAWDYLACICEVSRRRERSV